MAGILWSLWWETVVKGIQRSEPEEYELLTRTAVDRCWVQRSPLCITSNLICLHKSSGQYGEVTCHAAPLVDAEAHVSAKSLATAVQSEVTLVTAR